MSNPKLDLDLDTSAVAAGEVRGPFVVGLGGDRFELPPELPVDVLYPIVKAAPELFRLLQPMLNALTDSDAPDPLAAAMDVTDDPEKKQEVTAKGLDLLKGLVQNPNLPNEVVEAFLESGRRLFGEDQWAVFSAKRVSIPQVWTLIKGIGTRYGVSLGEALRSAASPESAGPTSKETSGSTSKSTPVRASSRRQTRGSSASGD